MVCGHPALSSLHCKSVTIVFGRLIDLLRWVRGEKVSFLVLVATWKPHRALAESPIQDGGMGSSHIRPT